MVEDAPELVAAMRRFWDVATSPVEEARSRFDDVVASSEGSTMIGTTEQEWFESRDRLREAVGSETGVRLEAKDVTGFRSGDVGWVQGHASFVLPNGDQIRTRFTAVLLNEAGDWKLTQGHFSVAVPDEEVVDLQKRWYGQ